MNEKQSVDRIKLEFDLIVKREKKYFIDDSRSDLVISLRSLNATKTSQCKLVRIFMLAMNIQSRSRKKLH